MLFRSMIEGVGEYERRGQEKPATQPSPSGWVGTYSRTKRHWPPPPSPLLSPGADTKRHLFLMRPAWGDIEGPHDRRHPKRGDPLPFPPRDVRFGDRDS